MTYAVNWNTYRISSVSELSVKRSCVGWERHILSFRTNAFLWQLHTEDKDTTGLLNVRRYPRHSVTSQKTRIFTNTALKPINLTKNRILLISPPPFSIWIWDHQMLALLDAPWNRPRPSVPTFFLSHSQTIVHSTPRIWHRQGTVQFKMCVCDTFEQVLCGCKRGLVGVCGHHL